MVDRLPGWAKEKPSSCRTCIYWDKPPEARALPDRYYECTAPMPSKHNFPESTFGTLDKRKMHRDEGTKCPTWADTFPEASK